MTPGSPATEDVFGRLAAMRVIPLVVLDDSAAAAPLANVGLPCVGGGDSFTAGLIFGLLDDLGLQMAVEYGAAHGVLAMTTPAIPPQPEKKKSTASSPTSAPVLTASRRDT
jgi:hypothetical protein